MSHVLLAHSSAEVASAFLSDLREEWLDAVHVHGGLQVVEHLRRNHVRLVLLEEALEDLPGVDVIRRIRAIATDPIVVLAEQDDEDSIVKALKAGADDYLAHPISQP